MSTNEGAPMREQSINEDGVEGYQKPAPGHRHLPMDCFINQKGDHEKKRPAFICVCDGVSSSFKSFKGKADVGGNLREILGIRHDEGVVSTDISNFGHPNELIPGYVMAMIVADEIKRRIEDAYRSEMPDYLEQLGYNIDQYLVDRIIVRMNSEQMKEALMRVFGSDYSYNEYDYPHYQKYFSAVAFGTGLAYATVDRNNRLRIVAYGDVKIKVTLKDGRTLENLARDANSQLGVVCKILKDNDGKSSLEIEPYNIDGHVNFGTFEIDEVEQVEICTDGVYERKQGQEQFDDETRLVIKDVKKWAGLD